MTFTPKSPEEMRKLAARATAGAWYSDRLEPECVRQRGTDDLVVVEVGHLRDTAFIAAANPAQFIHDADLILSLTKEVEGLWEALQRIAEATPANTNSATPERAFSWTAAVANAALDKARALSTSGRAE